MRNFHFGLATLMLLFATTSCNDEETVEKATDHKNVLSFSAAIGKHTVGTRATEFTAFPENDKLTVLSYYMSGAAYRTFELTNHGGTWSYTGETVNQPGPAIRYYSMRPVSALTDTTSANGFGANADGYSFGYTVGAEDVQEDLIGAKAITDENEVTLPFNHLLSQVNFALVKTMGIAIHVTNIKIEGVQSQGIYTFGNAAGTTGWRYPETPVQATYTYEYNDGTNVTDGLSTGISYMGNTGYTPQGVVARNDNDNALLLLPQTFVAGENDGKISFDFQLTVEKGSGTVNIPETGTEHIEADLDMFNTSAWLPGKRYLYLIDFESYLAGGPIVFRIELDQWEDDSDNTIAETLQVPAASAAQIELAISKHRAADAVVPNLAIFPIAVSGTVPAEGITLTDMTGFDANDKINIEFVSETDRGRFDIDVPGWSVTTSGRMATLVCTIPVAPTPDVDASLSGSDDAATARTKLETAIRAQAGANGATPANVLYTVNVHTAAIGLPLSITAIPDGAAPYAAGEYFDSGDVIRIECADAASAANLSLDAGVTGWTLVHTPAYGNIVLLKRD